MGLGVGLLIPPVEPWLGSAVFPGFPGLGVSVVSPVLESPVPPWLGVVEVPLPDVVEFWASVVRFWTLTGVVTGSTAFLKPRLLADC